MTEIKDRDEAQSPGVDDATPARHVTRLRLWPGALIALAHVAVSGGFWVFGSTNIHSFAGFAITPIAAAVALALWWLAASRIPVLERFAGLLLVGAAAGASVAAQAHDRAFILIVALPVLTTGMVGLLLLTSPLGWRIQRWVALCAVVVCAVVFSSLRVDSLGGNLFPILSWRWNPTAEEKMASAPGHGPGANKVASLPSQVSPLDWPGFRGPARDGRVVGQTFPTTWSPAPKELWRRPVGLGWSSFAAVGDYIFTQEQRAGEELVSCYRADTGEDVWTNRVPTRFEDNMGPGPRATPTFEQGVLYTLGATGVVQAIDASNGATVWKRDLAADTGAKTPTWGFASSPLVTGERVIVFSGGAGKSVIAYHRVTGEVAWRAGADTNGYSSPQLVRIADTPQILMVSDFGLQAFTPETGEQLWEHAWKAKPYPRVVQPLLVEPNAVLLGTPGTMGTRQARVTKDGAAWHVEEGWTLAGYRPYFNDGVLFEGHCFGFDGNRLVCVDVAAGKVSWEGKRCGGQILLVADLGALLLLTEAGDVMLVAAKPDQYRELAHFKALHGKTWNHPVVSRGRLFVRNSEEAACFELTAPAPNTPAP